MTSLRTLSLLWLGLLVAVLAGCAAPPASAISVESSPTPAALDTTSAAPAGPSGKKPNIVFILTDDLDKDSIKYMPRLQSLLVDQGTSFSNSFLNISLCCPSRTTILRGQYAINTKIFGNTPPNGGFQTVFKDGLEESMLPVWLQAAGYRTMLAGKYLNGYPDKSDPLYIPPGWTEWNSAMKGNAYSEFSYTLNENGKPVAYGAKPEDYGTDVYAGKAIDFIKRMSAFGQPFFVYLATYAPHGPSNPAPRHADLFPNARAPRTPNFNEADVSDKPAYIRNRPLLTPKQIATIDGDYRKRLQSLQAVDEAIGNLVDTLRTTGQLENTFIIFTSDNGFHLGNHRLAQGKIAPYEEDIRVPLIIRGPGIVKARTLDYLVGNVDFAPTIAALAGATVPDWVDGRSLVPLLSSDPPSIDQWRTAYLIQGGAPKNTASLVDAGLDTESEVTVNDPALLEPADPDETDAQQQRAQAIPPYFGIRTSEYTYVEYSTGERELYDLKSDPYELNNLASKQSNLVDALAQWLKQLKNCAGDSCHVADSLPVPPK